MVCGVQHILPESVSIGTEPASIAPRRQTAAGIEGYFLPLPEPFEPFEPLLDLELGNYGNFSS